MLSRCLVLTLLLKVLFLQPSSAAPGDFDTTFGVGGKVLYAFGSSDEEASDMVLQPDGKIIMVGYTRASSGTDTDFALVRFNTNGSPDGTFGTNGKVVTEFGNNDYARSIALQPDGKIVVVGRTAGSFGSHFALARYNPDGSLDSTFGNGGKVITDVGGEQFSTASDVIISHTGEIFVVGEALANTEGADVAFVRYLSNGSLDTSYYNGGMYVFPIGGYYNTEVAEGYNNAYDHINAAIVSENGRVYVAGFANQKEGPYLTGDENWMLLDITSGGGGGIGRGIIQRYFPLMAEDHMDDRATALAFQKDGRFLVAGSVQREGDTPGHLYWNFVVKRHREGGSDEGFGFDPYVTAAFDGHSSCLAYGIAVESDDRFIVVGDHSEQFAIMRFNTDGSLDTRFGGDGKITKSAGGDSCYARCVAVQANGKILVGGSSKTGSNFNFALIRLEGSPVPDVNITSVLSITAVSATVNLTFNPMGLSSSGSVQYGETDQYGTSKPVTVSPADGTTAQTRSVSLTGLQPGTTYHYRLVGTNSEGTNTTSDRVFTTLQADDLTSIIVNTGQTTILTSPTFTSSKLFYSIGLANQITNISIRPVAAHPNATIRIKNVVVNSGSYSQPINMPVGSPVVDVNVWAPGATESKAYRLYPTRVAQGAPGDVLSFSSSTTNTYVRAIATQPDGKTLIGGAFTSVLGNARTYIARLNADGTLDASFNVVLNGEVYSILVGADERILLGGNFTTAGGSAHNYLCRINADGTVDHSFAMDTNNVVLGFAEQVDGKIVVLGSFTVFGGATRSRCARLNVDGTLDADFAPAITNAFCVAIQADGKILAGGGSGLKRYLSNGALDTSFIATNAYPFIRTICIQPDGKILVGGDFDTVNEQPRYRMARLNSDGSLDASFDADLNHIPYDATRNVYTAILQQDGRILVGGYFDSISTASGGSYLIRLNTDGSLDQYFEPNPNGAVHGLLLRQDGVILAGGNFGSMGGVVRQGMALIANDAAPESLIVASGGRVQWLRYGAGQEVVTAKFDLSTDGGASWTQFGNGVRIANGWQITPSSLPANGLVRVRARINGGFYNGSSSLIEKVSPFGTALPLPVAVTGQANAFINTATLQASVNAMGGTASAWFEYGRTTSYGQIVAATPSPVIGSILAPVSAEISGLVSGTRYHYRVVAQNATGIVYGEDQVFGTAFLAPASSIQSWRYQYFGSVGNTENGADTATPDQDGIANLMKYALNIEPGSSAAALLPSGEVRLYPEGKRLSMVFQRNPAHDDVTLEVQVTDDLTGGWTSVATSVNGAAFSGPGFVSEMDAGDGIKNVEIRDTESPNPAAPTGRNRFMRLKATR